MLYPIIPDIDKMPMLKALTLIDQLRDDVETFKVHSLADREMASTVRLFKEAGAKKFFLDWKIDDMKDTAAERAAKIRDAGVDILTVHSQGRVPMIEAAVKNGPPIILVVTMLTSWSDEDIEESFRRPALEVIAERAMWAVKGGAHGIVCPPRHVGKISKIPEFQNLIKLAPGTRSAGIATNDQKQVDTPYNAVFGGGEKVWLVGGRQITQSDNPRGALLAMAHDVSRALANRKLGDTQEMATI